MPAAHSASITTKMLQQLEGTTVIGPILTGRPVLDEQSANLLVFALPGIVNRVAIVGRDTGTQVSQMYADPYAYNGPLDRVIITVSDAPAGRGPAVATVPSSPASCS